MGKRDDFTTKIKEALANSVGRRCSNPTCRKLTCCANSNSDSITNVGVAAHICAAAKGGPRYDTHMTAEERKSINNGIWLCANCAKMIDSDIEKYPKQLLYYWKYDAEQKARGEVESLKQNGEHEQRSLDESPNISGNYGQNQQIIYNSTIIGNNSNG